ncbi:hypothetical protein L209DRAFT_685320 [Thermothelomyces heterothallicus CBS 203.75]
MNETPSRPPEGTTTKAVKDKSCPYCHQAFTSSSLGRHLDLYIREKNPKPPDGVHDVEAIRKLRQNITRRQPKGSASRRVSSAAVGTPTTASRRSPASGDAGRSVTRSPNSSKGDLQAGAASGSQYPFKHRWEDTGVINDLALRDGVARGEAEGKAAAQQLPRREPSQRSAARQMLKQQLEMRQQVQDAEDRSRAAELALRELLGSLRAAKRQIDIGSTPFDFDPFSLDFPALTLQCLDPPPTLFASTQHPTSTSWSILPPGHAQLEALYTYFREEFRRWKIACAAATTALSEELTYPPPLDAVSADPMAEVRKAEKSAEQMEKHVYDHLEATYAIWDALAQDQREQLWRLELARGVGRRRREVDKLKEGQHLLRQEVAVLKSQIEQLSRLQQPREFKIAPPPTLYIDEKFLTHLQEEAMRNGKHLVGLSLSDRGSDLNTLVSSVIDRWKSVIVSARSAASGLQAQRTLSPGAAGPSPRGSTCDKSTPNKQDGLQMPQQSSICRDRPRPQQLSTACTHGPSYPVSATSPNTASMPTLPETPAVPSTTPSINIHADDDEDEEMSDRDAELAGEPQPNQNARGDAEGNPSDADADADADADMDDNPGGYTEFQAQPLQRQQQLHPVVPVPAPSQQAGQLGVARTRAQLGGGKRSNTDDGTSGHVVTDQIPESVRGRMPSWA